MDKFFALFLMMASPLMAAEKPGYLAEELSQVGTTAAAAEIEAPSLLWTLLDIGGSLLVVVGIIYLAYWLLLKWRDKQGLQAGTDRVGLIKVLERQSLDAKHGIAVVEVGDKILTLGLGEQITLLDRVEDPEQIERMRQQAPLPASIMGFKEQLQRVGLRMKKEAWSQSKSVLREQSEELEEQMQKLKKRRGGDA